MSSFEKELRSLLNCHSMENGSDTPDYILATYLLDCLHAFNKAVRDRAEWHHIRPTTQETDPLLRRVERLEAWQHEVATAFHEGAEMIRAKNPAPEKGNDA